MNIPAPDILCIGSALWDVIGRAAGAIGPGADVPGRIVRQPGGVALNVARALARLGRHPALLGAIGRDDDGAALVAACAAMGVEAGFCHRPDARPTDRYMAIEGAGGLVAAVADARTLEAAGVAILAPLADGRLGSAAAPWRGLAVLDGNLSEALLAEIAQGPLLAAADLRVAAASPAKAARLRPLLGHRRATFYLNLAEAGQIAGRAHSDAAEAAAGLVAQGAARVLVTDGGGEAALAGAGCGGGVIRARPPAVAVARVTGAGDTLMAAHIAADLGGAAAPEALAAALHAAAAHISQGDAP